MRIFLDTEFIEDGKTIDLISIGIVAEDGSKLYLQNVECDLSKASDWVKHNVIPYLDSSPWVTRGEIRDTIKEFCGQHPEFWGYYADYDWVVLCQLFGRMIDLPRGWPLYCNDIKQLAVQLGDPDLHKVCDTSYEVEHHALADAKWVKRAYDYLRTLA